MSRTTEYKRYSTYVAEHMFKALNDGEFINPAKGLTVESLTVQDLERILKDALNNAHPDGGYVLYVP